MTIQYEPMSPGAWKDPYPIYQELREKAPLHRGPESGIYCLSRHEDVAFALRNAQIFSSRGMQEVLFDRGGMRPGLRDLPALARFFIRARVNPLRRNAQGGGLIGTDPPEHDALRSVVNRGFTPRRVAAWEPRMREIAAAHVGALEAGEAFDVVRDLAIPLPVTVIAEMLGVQGERMRDFKRWSDAIVSAATGTKRDAGLAGMLDPMGEMRQYMASIIPERRRNPKDDLISVLVDPRHEDTLDEDQVFGFIVLLLVAGNETTTNLIGNATVTLLDHPAELEHVQADPALVPQMVEEVLRYDTPVHLLFRSTTQEVELSGGKLPAGAQVAVILASANRDPRVFDDPDRFDVTRTSNTHIAFGFGVHFCLGASLARLEAKVAMEALVPHLPQRRRSSEELDYIDSFLVRGPRSLELIVSA